MGEAAKLFTRSLMMGLDSSVRKEEFAELTAEDIENLPYAEAVEYLKKRDVIKKVDYDSLSDKMRFRAFTASRIADGDLLKKLNAEMIASVNDGKGLSDFLSLTKTDILDKIGMGAGSGWYYETVYRTNVQTAYNVGRAMGFADDKPLALELVIIDDSRTSDICRQYAGKRFILPYDHPFWQTHWPPFHFNCRTTIRAIYDESELPENWSNPKDIEDANNGFGAYPLAGDGWWNELASQVARAKEYGVQGEIEAAKVALGVGSGQIKGVETNPKISDNSSKELERFEVKIEKVENEIAGVKRGQPMSFDEADNGNANPHYKPYSPTADNCQSCVVAFKARLDGFDVQAKAYDESNTIMVALSENTSLAWIDKNTGTFPEYMIPKKNYVPLLQNWLEENLLDNTYYTVEFYRKHIPDGHIMLAFKDKGSVAFYDPQSDETLKGEALSLLLYATRKNTIKLLNISNCFLNKSVVDYILEVRT